MREPILDQKTRFILLLIDTAILCAASWIAFGRIFPSEGERGFWFYSALLGLILGSRLDTPFFAKPADVVLYAAPAAIALALINVWDKWDDGVRVAYVLAMTFCIVTALLGAIAILTKDATQPTWRQASNAARVLSETLGAPRTIFSIIIAFAVFAFHKQSPKEFGVIIAAWVLTGVLSPLEGSVRVARRLSRVFKPNAVFDTDGEVAAYQTPGLMLIRQSSQAEINCGDFLAVHDPLGQSYLALALDHVGRDEGLLLRAVQITDVETPHSIRSQMSELAPNSVMRISNADDVSGDTLLLRSRSSLVGIVAPDTSIERLFFEVVKNDELEEGRLVEVRIADRTVTYQLVNGLTKEEIVQQKNTNGFVRAQAQKIGEWDATSNRFKFAKWLPQPNAPVLLKGTGIFEPRSEAIGHFPGTDYGVTLKTKDNEEIGLEALVTHNTAILGILGVGKSSIALELVERMMAGGIKVVCLDLTNQYETELAPYYDKGKEATSIQKLQSVGPPGKGNVKKNVEEGGSRNEFTKAIRADLELFLDDKNPARLKLYNPTQFEVWKQDSKPYQDTASMVSLTAPEVTHIVSDCVLQIVARLGMTDKARVCLVYEEAHSLVPEWNSAVADGDRSSANGTARAILQGRKYGLGCLLVSQRTANVTKTILNQCNTVFAMRTFDDTGKEFLANYLGREYANLLSSLEERHAIFFGRGSNCENPVLMRANDREDFVRIFRAVNPPAALTAVTPPIAAAAAEPRQSVRDIEDDMPF